MPNKRALRNARISNDEARSPRRTPSLHRTGTAKQSRARLADIAHDRLEELIVTLQLPPGSLWSEATLSEKIKIGRTPVREALQRLAGTRLVNVIRRHGIQISDIDAHEQMLVVELRRELEQLVAKCAARRATVEERRYISQSANQFLDAAATENVMKFLSVHFESKKFIVACARNPFLESTFVPLNSLTRRFFFVYQNETKDVATAAKLHAAVLKAIASGDEAAAADAANAMVDYAEFYTRAVITGR
jgi:DNA-binding GntR family transcriptional regulator